MIVRFIQKKQYRMLRKYIVIHIVTAIVGIILFPASIYHIFISYRGAGGEGNGRTIIESLEFYLKQLGDAFSINNVFMYVLIAIAVLGIILRLVIKAKNIKINKIERLSQFLLLVIPTVIYFVIVSYISPNVEAKYAIRYIMPILPEISIIFILGVYRIFKNKKIAMGFTTIVVLVITINGLITNEPKYLYRGYNNYLEIAEKYKDLDFVYVVDNGFTHINSIPEFMTYNKSLIVNINFDKLDFLKTDEELQGQDQFILCIKKWLNVDDTLNQILENSGFTQSELLINQNDDTQSAIYLISK